MADSFGPSRASQEATIPAGFRVLAGPSPSIPEPPAESSIGSVRPGAGVPPVGVTVPPLPDAAERLWVIDGYEERDVCDGEEVVEVLTAAGTHGSLTTPAAGWVQAVRREPGQSIAVGKVLFWLVPEQPHDFEPPASLTGQQGEVWSLLKPIAQTASHPRCLVRRLQRLSPPSAGRPPDPLTGTRLTQLMAHLPDQHPEILQWPGESKPPRRVAIFAFGGGRLDPLNLPDARDASLPPFVVLLSPTPLPATDPPWLYVLTPDTGVAVEHRAEEPSTYDASDLGLAPWPRHITRLSWSQGAGGSAPDGGRDLELESTGPQLGQVLRALLR